MYNISNLHLFCTINVQVTWSNPHIHRNRDFIRVWDLITCFLPIYFEYPDKVACSGNNNWDLYLLIAKHSVCGFIRIYIRGTLGMLVHQNCPSARGTLGMEAHNRMIRIVPRLWVHYRCWFIRIVLVLGAH